MGGKYVLPPGCAALRGWQTLAGKRAGRRRLAPRQTSRKGTSRLIGYRILGSAVELSLPARRKAIRRNSDLRSRRGARMLARRVGRDAADGSRKTVMNLTLIDAFGRFGAIPASRLSSLSAMTTDGALVLNCMPANFGHPSDRKS